MESVLVTLNHPVLLWGLLAGAVTAVLVDYLFPVDWLAYVGYVLFGVFIGATIPAGSASSFLVMAVVIAVMLVLHRFLFSKFLTNAPRYERSRSRPDESV